MCKTLEEWLFYLENRYAVEMQLGLSRIRKVAESLSLLKPLAQVVTVAGTNGKGSTVAALEAIYSTGGYQVGTYTSPHVSFFNERIKINQKPLKDEALIEAFEVIEKARGATHLTYFEAATLAALWQFKKHQVDLIILEVGIGGRLDATNIIDNDLAIITTIDFDHQAYLGDTLEAIGSEKAGIIRSKKPVIYADDNPPSSILEKVETSDAYLYRKNKEYHYQLSPDNIIFHFESHKLKLNKPVLHPNSLAAAVMASFCLQEALPLSDVARIAGIAQVHLKGRLQYFTLQGKTVLIDVAHNPQAVAYLVNFIKGLSYNALHAVFGALADKDLKKMVAIMDPVVDYWYPAKLDNKRALPLEQMQVLFENNEKCLKVCHNSPVQAFNMACNEAKSGDLIVVFGSFITVGAIRSIPYPSYNF